MALVGKGKIRYITFSVQYCMYLYTAAGDLNMQKEISL